MRTWLLALTALCVAQAPASQCPTPTVSTSGYFTANGTQILDPSGKPFQMRGINLYGDSGLSQLPNAIANAQAQPLTDMFPGINFVRVNMFDQSGVTAAQLEPYIATLSKLGIVMEIEDHNYPGVLSGSDLTNAEQWYAEIAAANVGNPYVIFGTQNEPGGDPQEEITGIINAIRGAGNNTLILVNPTGGTSTAGVNLAGATNVAWDLHFYAWEGTDANALASVVAKAQSTANIPVVIGEYGWACCSGVDPGWQGVIQAVDSSGHGSAAWAWTSGGSLPVLLNDPGGNAAGGLTPFGQMVAQFTSKSGATGQGSYATSQFAPQLCQLSQTLYPNPTYQQLEQQVQDAQSAVSAAQANVSTTAPPALSSLANTTTSATPVSVPSTSAIAAKPAASPTPVASSATVDAATPPSTVQNPVSSG